MKTALGLSLDPGVLRAVVVRRGSVTWAATAPFNTLDDLNLAVSDLARDCPAGVRTLHLSISGSVAQLRLVDGLPRLSRAELVRHVRLSPRRYFLQNGARLICDAEPSSG